MTAQELLEQQACHRPGCVCAVSLRKGRGLTHCPAHLDEHPSLNAEEKDGRTVFRCHAGCSQDSVLAAVKELRPAGAATAAANGHQRREVATYDYRDEAGELVYQVVRYEPKDFRQRKPKAGGGWSWSLNGTRRLLYGLPELLAARERRWVLLVEGEKDADRLRSLGVLATCYAGGVKAPWQPAWAEALRGRRVAILPDADRPGLARAERDATQLSRVCADLRVVALPGLLVREDHGEDVSDWLDRGHDVDELKALVDAAPAWTPAPVAADPDPTPEAEAEALEEEYSSRSTWAPMDIAAILAGDLSPLEPTLLRRVDGIPLLYPGRVSMFVGEPESCKSWAAQLAARQAIAGGDTVLYIDFEAEARDVVGHLLALGCEPPELAEQLLYVRPEESFDDRGRTALLAGIARQRPSYVVLDGVSSAMVAEGLEPNSNKEYIQWFSKLVTPLRACTDGPLVLVDHVSKDKEHRGDWAVGAGQKKARVDGAMLAFDLVQPFGRGKTGVISILLFKDRPGYLRGRTVNGKEIARLELASDPETEEVTAQLLLPAAGSVPDKAGKWRPTGLMERVSQLLDRSPEPLSTNAVVKGVHGKATYIHQALDALLEEGFIERLEGPRRALLFRSVELFIAAATSSRPRDEVGRSDNEEEELPFEEEDEPTSSPLLPDAGEEVSRIQDPSSSPLLPNDAGRSQPGLSQGADFDVRSTSSLPPKGEGRTGDVSPGAPAGARDAATGKVICPSCQSFFFRLEDGLRTCVACGQRYHETPF